jgi:hypothetical protein
MHGHYSNEVITEYLAYITKITLEGGVSGGRGNVT